MQEQRCFFCRSDKPHCPPSEPDLHAPQAKGDAVLPLLPYVVPVLQERLQLRDSCKVGSWWRQPHQCRQSTGMAPALAPLQLQLPPPTMLV